MSRVGKKPLPIPRGVEVRFESGILHVKGPLGQADVPIRPEVGLKLSGDFIEVERQGDLKIHRSLHGTVRQVIQNALVGVSAGFRKELLVVGAGYRAKVEGGRLVLVVGYSHQVEYRAPQGVKIEVSDERLSVGGYDAIKVIVSGTDRQMVGQIAAEIRLLKPPDSYKGKGIRYANEVVHLKPGKSVAGGT